MISGQLPFNRLYFLQTGVLFVGPVVDNQEHRHHAFQIALSPGEPLTVFTSTGTVQGRGVAVGANVPHRMQATAAETMLVLVDAEHAAVHSLLAGCPAGSAVTTLPSPRRLEIDRVPTDCASAVRCFNAIIDGGCGDRRARPPSARDERIASALSAIDSRLNATLTLAQIAATVHLSGSRFAHLFTEQIGIPFRRYVLWARIKRAVSIALAGEQLTTAAIEAGFADQAHFTRVFRRTFGFSPSTVIKNSRFVQARVCASD